MRLHDYFRGCKIDGERKPIIFFNRGKLNLSPMSLFLGVCRGDGCAISEEFAESDGRKVEKTNRSARLSHPAGLGHDEIPEDRVRESRVHLSSVHATYTVFITRSC